MVKVYKYNNKLAIYLPFDVIKDLGLSENDEIDFFRFRGSAYLFAKKADIADLLAGSSNAAENLQNRNERQQSQQPKADLSQDEISVLKKLDTLRYNQRTQQNVDRLLSPQEREILRQLLKKKAVSLFRSGKDDATVYSIGKSVYDRFLMRKKPQAVESTVPQDIDEHHTNLLRVRGNVDDENIKKLEKEGYIVLQTESEAAAVSAALEESIRHGQVFGTRAFNKKFYIMLRSFLERYSSQIIKELRSGDKKVPEIAERVRMDENGVRAVLYYMAEIGDVSEKRRDLFTLT